MSNHPNRTMATILVAALLTVTACTGSSSDEVAATTATSDTARPPRDEPSTTNALSDIPPETTPAPSTTTTAPPSEPATTLTTDALDDGVEQTRMNVLADATASADGDALIVVGSTAAAPGEFEEAVVNIRDYAADEDYEWRLETDDAIETFANAVDVNGDRLIVVGTALVADGTSTSQMWTSDAVDSPFGQPRQILDVASRADDVVAWDGGIAVVSVAEAGSEFDLVVSTSLDAGPWNHTTIETAGPRPSVGGLVRFGERLVLTADFDDDGVPTSRSWTSDDDGATFVGHDDPVLAESSDVGAPSVIDGELWAITTRAGNLPARMAQSIDGATWRAVDISVTRDGVDVALVDNYPGRITIFDGRFAFGTSDNLTTIALVDRSGRGTVHDAVQNRFGLFSAPIPVVVQDRLYSAANSHTDWRADQWFPDGPQSGFQFTPPSGASGPTPYRVAVSELLIGVAATAFTFPLITTSNNRTRWESDQKWLVETDDDSWEPVEARDVPPSADLAVNNGTLDMATVGAFNDPGDDEIDGPAGGTRVLFRSPGESWVLQSGWLLTGPGSDAANDVAPTPDGFLLVGDSTNRSADGRRTSFAILKEFVDDQWIDLPIGSDLGDRAALYSIAQADNGARVATGTRFDGVQSAPFVLAPNDEGVWTFIELPGASPRLDVVDLIGSTESIELVARDGTDWVLYSSTDGTSFESTPLDFEESSVSVTNAVDLDGETVFVGSVDRLAARTLAAWRLTDGIPESIDLPNAPFGHDLRVSDAIVNADGDVVIGAVLRNQSLAITVSIAGA